MPWSVSKSIKRLSSSISFSSLPPLGVGDQPQQKEMGACFSGTRCPCSEAKTSSSIVPSSVSTHFVRLSAYEFSPFTASIRIALQFKGIQPDFVNVDPGDERYWLDHAFQTGKFPKLEHGEDSVSGSPDSILEYIDRTFILPPLMMPSWKLKKKVWQWVSYVRETFIPLVLDAWRTNKNPVLDLDFRSRFRAAFDKLNSGIAEHRTGSGKYGKYFLGKYFCMVDVYLLTFLELLEPLKLLRGIEVDGSEHSCLVDYMGKLPGCMYYTPVAADAERLKLMAYKELEENSRIDPAVTFTLLQHASIVRHLEVLAEGLSQLHHSRSNVRASSTKMSLSKSKKDQLHRVPSVELVSITTKLKKAAGDYERLLALMKEHAQAEEKFLFPALEKAQRGVTKIAVEEHARDFPVMNGVREDLKTVMVMENGSFSQTEALTALANKVNMLKNSVVKHFQEEEKEILPLLAVAGLGEKQQEALMVSEMKAMELTNSSLLPFFFSSLLPHEIHCYMTMLHRSFRDGTSRLESIVRVMRSDEEFQGVWRIVQDRVPLLAAAPTPFV